MAPLVTLTIALAVEKILYRLALVYGLIGERRGRIGWWKPE